jgi:hypothetical protein
MRRLVAIFRKGTRRMNREGSDESRRLLSQIDNIPISPEQRAALSEIKRRLLQMIPNERLDHSL